MTENCTGRGTSSGLTTELQEFHAFFAASFGRKHWRDHSGYYLQALAGAGPGSAQRRESLGIGGHLGPGDQRFLTEARWSDETVIGRLQEYLAPRLGHPEAVMGVRWQRLPQVGLGSRQYAAGWARWPMPGWDVPGSPLGRAKRVSAQEPQDLLRREFRTTGGTTGPWPWSC